MHRNGKNAPSLAQTEWCVNPTEQRYGVQMRYSLGKGARWALLDGVYRTPGEAAYQAEAWAEDFRRAGVGGIQFRPVKVYLSANCHPIPQGEMQEAVRFMGQYRDVE